jgi:pyrimidine-nucleoside phosphorylase
MALSGDVLNLENTFPNCVDKHSTGGIGDKTTLIIAPILAACGVKTAKMSGRGLGFTGGTIDKLESIDGFSVNLSEEKFMDTVRNVGTAIVSQTKNLAPADKKLYALRDVTGTVNSIPLIASSIMSKKLAAGTSHILLDVKTGSGAFMKTKESALELSKTMVAIGEQNHKNVTAIITDMNIPLGFAVGNALEVIEAQTILLGKQKDRLFLLCIELCAHLLHMAKDISLSDAKKIAEMTIDNGTAYQKFCDMITAQDGDITSLSKKEAPIKKKITAMRDGYITKIDSAQIGLCSLSLGAGRHKKEDKIDYTAGIYFSKTYGDMVKKGDVLATLHTSNIDALKEAGTIFESAIEIGNEEPKPLPLIYGCVTKDDIQ